MESSDSDRYKPGDKVAAGPRRLLDAVAPVVDATQQPHHPTPDRTREPLDEQVDRQGVAQLLQIGETQLRQGIAVGCGTDPRIGRRAEIAVGE